jgi:hypothetical protein
MKRGFPLFDSLPGKPLSHPPVVEMVSRISGDTPHIPDILCIHVRRFEPSVIRRNDGVSAEINSEDGT